MLKPGSRILVVGAGLAGCSASRALVRAGFNVTLVEAKRSPASGTSGNPAGIFKPILTLKATPSSRFSFLAFGALLGVLDELRNDGFRFAHSAKGLVQLPRSEREAGKLKEALKARRVSPEFAQWLSSDEASSRLGNSGWKTPFGAVWYPKGGWIGPAEFCEALLKSAGAELKTSCEIPLNENGLKRACQDAGTEAIVFCTAEKTRALPEFEAIRTQVIRGQLSEIEMPEGLAFPEFPVSFKEYVIPVGERRVVLGATHDRGDESTETRPEDHLRLLERFGEMLPDKILELARANPVSLRAGVRFSPSTYLPVVGHLPITSGRIGKPAYCLTGLGSRGILTALLSAEVLACEMSGRPAPVPDDIRIVMSPR